VIRSARRCSANGSWEGQDVDAYNNRGEAYEAKNDLDHAIADFDHALKLAETYTGAIDPLLAKARQDFECVQALLAKRSDPGAQTDAPPR
jgi:tetratricopeptide (TPR) repeat protein